MDARFEDDLIEIAGDGNYLMLCRERRTLFLEGAAQGKVPLDDVASFRADGTSIVIRDASGEERVQSFASAGEAFAADAAAKLNASAAAWR